MPSPLALSSHAAIASIAVLVLPAASQPESRDIVAYTDSGIAVQLSDDAIPPGAPGGVWAPFGTAPDWANDFRRQVGGLQVADMNQDGRADVVVGCYKSNSFPPYDHWFNYIYMNVDGTLETDPSWISDDEVSTGDVRVADLNGDGYLDVFSANGGFAMSPSRIYFGFDGGVSTASGWTSNESGLAWNNAALLCDIDQDGDVDVITANQGNSQDDPYRPMYLFRNSGGTIETVPSWQSAEESIQNFLSCGDLDGDGWDDIAVAKWANFESGVYRNVGGTPATTPMWTTGLDDTDKGIGWLRADGDDADDLVLGYDDATTVYLNSGGSLTEDWATDDSLYHGHSDLVVHDIDGDGDDDFAEIHFANAHVRVYLNDNGSFPTVPSWQYDAPGAGTALAFGDINGDGVEDLVVGLSGDISVMVFHGIARPCAGDLDGDGTTGVDDLLSLLSAWGTDGAGAALAEPLNIVDVSDLLALLAQWGPC